MKASVLLLACSFACISARAAETVLYASTNEYASIAISSFGRISSLRVGGAELVRSDWGDYLVHVNNRDGAGPSSFSSPSNGFFVATCSTVSPATTVKFHVVAEKFGWTFCLDSVSSTNNVNFLFFTSIRPTCRTYGGGQQNMLNMMSDDTYGVVLHGYDLNVETAFCTTNTGLNVYTSPTCGFAPARAGLAAGTRAQMPALLEMMRVVAGAPYSAVGGPGALKAPINRGSYLFASLTPASVEDWIDLARRAGCTLLHADQSWTSSFGSYPVRTNAFPNGLADFSAIAARIHAAGLRFGIHTYTGGVAPTDALAACYATNLLPTATYTLASALTASATTLAVGSAAVAEEGKYLQVDRELMTYTGVSGKSFTGLARGACGTTAAAHSAGAAVTTPLYHYGCFSAIGGSPLAAAVGAAMSNVVAATAADEVYFDAADMSTRYNIDSVRRSLYNGIGRTNIQIEAACEGFHSWWFHSMLGAWDVPAWGIKRAEDLHLSCDADDPMAELLPAQTGWFAPSKRFPNNISHGVFEDDCDYVGVKNLAHDLALSIENADVSASGYFKSSGALQPYALRNVTVLGWYERARLASAVDASTRARLAVRGDEYILRQQTNGVWRFQPLAVRKHRVNVLGNGSESWTVNVTNAAAARLRILALNPPATNGTSSVLITYDNSARVLSDSDASAATATVTHVTSAHGSGFGLTVQNKTAATNGVWGAVTCTPTSSYGCSDRNAFGFWVNGDGQGERLLVMLKDSSGNRTPHVFDIDFIGWRYLNFAFYERDMDVFADDAWPDGDEGTINSRSLYQNPFSGAAIQEIVFALGRLPANASSHVDISPITSYRTGSFTMTNAVLTVNNQSIPVPFVLNNTDFADLDEHGWIRYNYYGQELQAVQTDFVLPVLDAGSNAVSLAAENATPAVPLRADVTFFAAGEPFGAIKAATSNDSTILDREYMLPLWYSVAGGATNFPPILVRPGRTCSLEVELSGYLSNPTLTIDGIGYTFTGVGFTANADHLVCTDGQNWIVYDTSRNVRASGSLKTALPKLSGGAHALGFTTPFGGKCGWIHLTKVYDPDPNAGSSTNGETVVTNEPPVVVLGNFIWTGAAGTADWSTAANWDRNAVPCASNDVFITGGASVSVTGLSAAASVTVSGAGTLLALTNGASLAVLSNIVVGVSGSVSNRLVVGKGACLTAINLLLSAPVGKASTESRLVVDGGTVTNTCLIILNANNGTAFVEIRNGGTCVVSSSIAQAVTVRASYGDTAGLAVTDGGRLIVVGGVQVNNSKDGKVPDSLFVTNGSVTCSQMAVKPGSRLVIAGDTASCAVVKALSLFVNTTTDFVVPVTGWSAAPLSCQKLVLDVTTNHFVTVDASALSILSACEIPLIRATDGDLPEAITNDISLVLPSPRWVARIVRAGPALYLDATPPAPGFVIRIQ